MTGRWMGTNGMARHWRTGQIFVEAVAERSILLVRLMDGTAFLVENFEKVSLRYRSYVLFTEDAVVVSVAGKSSV